MKKTISISILIGVFLGFLIFSPNIFSADNQDNKVSGPLVDIALNAYDGTNWDRIVEGVVFPTALKVDSAVISNASSRITTNTDTVVTGGNQVVTRVTVETAGTTSTVSLYDDATGACDTGLVLTLPTTTAGSDYAIGHKFTNRICITTAGGVAATISVMEN